MMLLLRKHIDKAEKLSQELVMVAMLGSEAFDSEKEFLAFNDKKKKAELQQELDNIAIITNMPYRIQVEDFMALNLSEGPCAPDDFSYYESKKWFEKLNDWWDELKKPEPASLNTTQIDTYQMLSFLYHAIGQKMVKSKTHNPTKETRKKLEELKTILDTPHLREALSDQIKHWIQEQEDLPF